MDSIAVTKPDMGVLSRERLPLSPFGALAQAFAEDLLARAEQEEGRWPFVPLDLLEEGEDPPAPAAGSPRTALQVDLQLVLEVLRREGTPSEQRRATERIVERVLRLQEVRDRSRRDRPPAAQTAGPSMTVLGTLHQEFHQHLTQNIRIAPTLSPGAAPQGRQAPGTLARQAAEFSRQLQALREEGKAFPPPSAPAPAPGRAEPIPTPAPDRIRPTEGQAVQALPREALTLLEEQGDEAARNAAAAQTSALRQAGERLQKLVADALEQERPAPAQRPSSPREETRRTRPETDRPAPANAPQIPDGQPAVSSSSAPQPADTKSENNSRPAVRTAARDIRMGRESGPMEAIVPPPAAQVQGQALPTQPPVELSLKTEQEPAGENPAARRQAAPSAGTPAKAGQASAAPEHREARAAQKPAVIEQEYAPQTVRTAAKDIRMGRESGPMETIAPTPAPRTQGQVIPTQPPVELSLKTEQEPAGENAAAGRQAVPSADTPAKAGQASAAPEHREARAAQEPAIIEHEHSPQAVRTAARDIRMGRDSGPMAAITPTAAAPAVQAQGQALTGQPPVELSLKAEEAPAGENPAARRQAAPSAGTPTKAGQASAVPEHRDARAAQKPVVTEREHTHRAFHTTARDIRMRSRPLQRPADGSGTRSAVSQAGPRDAAAPEPGTWSPAPAELTLGPQGGSGETVTAGGTFSVGRMEAQPEPVTLTYGPGQQQGAQTPPQETAPSSGYRESEYVRSLPEWARNFLRSSADPQAAKTMGVARDISALQAPPAEEDVQWTAPNYRPPEAPIAYREKKSEASPRAVEEVRISEAEIQRTADRVYRIIEDRIRLERHRLGL